MFPAALNADEQAAVSAVARAAIAALGLDDTVAPDWTVPSRRAADVVSR
ncbi:hypothetical protein IU486_15495 [Streptomyces gardneri]|nr:MULTISPECIES: hypothetical protein [Nocardia]MBF6166160.1 hypothetical protein [Streptomyces gardneri]MBF6205582.1 hypothetical protein [Streptomyces gardneri]UAK31858.1 hypothetical protein K8O92_29640 [Nocardia asteroides]